jgi:hypothetical protein
MPSTSKKQHSFMAAVAHSPSFAKKVGVPQSVGKDFSNADKGKTFKKGGDTMAKANPFMEMIAKKKAMGTKKMASGGITSAKMGSVKTAAPSRDGVATKGKTKGTMVKMSGSAPLGMKRGGKC